MKAHKFSYYRAYFVRDYTISMIQGGRVLSVSLDNPFLKFEKESFYS